MSGDLRLDAMMKSIDVYGRLAFGGQCVAAMALLGGPLLFITASILPVVVWDDNRAQALGLWLGGWLLAVGVTAGAAAFAAFCWRWSGDWITEWPGYAVAFGIAGIADAVLAWMLTSTPVPIYLSFLATMGAALIAGIAVAGNLAGMHVLSETRLQRQRSAVKRR
jgi:hypothetical protein